LIGFIKRNGLEIVLCQAKEKPMLTSIPWMFVGLIGAAVSAILLVVEWYIWDSRYRMSAQLKLRPARVRTANNEDVIEVPSASGRQVVVTLAAQLRNRDSLPIHQVTGETTSTWL
jgi:hypothetical protein